ncbi:MAG: hypothetical protein AAGI03_02775 [Pseudomonadota bacterium]
MSYAHMTDTFGVSPAIYNGLSRAAERASLQDDAWFNLHPAETLRVRRVFPGEAPIVEALERSAAKVCAFVVVIDHIRACDTRAVRGRFVYPVPVEMGPPDRMFAAVTDWADELQAHFWDSPIEIHPTDENQILSLSRADWLATSRPVGRPDQNT